MIIPIIHLIKLKSPKLDIFVEMRTSSWRFTLQLTGQRDKW